MDEAGGFREGTRMIIAILSAYGWLAGLHFGGVLKFSGIAYCIFA